MKAILIHEFGGAEQLKAEEAPVPQPRVGEVRVKVAAAGLNFTEIYQRKGQSANHLPFVLGGEFAGTVDAVGEGVTEFQPGDWVGTASGKGGYAEYALASAQKLVKIPENISLELAAAVLLQGMTAHYLALSTFPIKPGDVALVHSAAGGVGQLLVQIAKFSGATVIGTVSTEEKAQIAKEAGADEIIFYRQEDFETRTQQLTGGKGVDVVYDGVGKDAFFKGLNCLKPRGMMVLYGNSSGLVEPLDPMILNHQGSLFLTRPTLRDYTADSEELRSRASDIFEWIRSKKLKVKIDKRFPLEQAVQAHQYMESGQTKGKVLLTP